MRRLTRGTIREARNILTLTRARTSGSGSVGAAIPQPTAQNEMLIADATPAWTLLAAPTAQYQVPIAGADPYTPAWAALTIGAISDLAYVVPALTLSTANAEGAADTVIRSDATILVFDATVPNTIQPDDPAAAGSASIAARRDHEHAIVCAAPASPSVNLAASAEGTGTSFARADHAHQLDQAIAPTWTALHAFAAHIAMSAATSYIRMDTSDGSDSKRIALCGGGDLADTRGGTIWLGGNEYSGGEGEVSIVAGNAVGGDIALWTAGARRVVIKHDGVVTVTVADNAAQALRLMDAGGLEYLRVASVDAQPVVIFNEGGADINHRWEASGQANALFVQGSDGKIGIWASTLNARVEIGGTPGPAMLNLPTNLSTIDAGLSSRNIADECIVAFGANIRTTYTGRTVTAEAGACIRCDTRDQDTDYTVFHVITRAAGAAEDAYTIPLKIAAGAPTNSLFIARDGKVGAGIVPVYNFQVHEDSDAVVTMAAFLNSGAVTAGRKTSILLGKSTAAGGAATLGYFSDTGTPANARVVLGHWGDSEATEYLNILKDGRASLGTATPATSALLDLVSTARALLLTRMTTAQRDALTAVNGMVLYNTTTTRLEAYENGAWVDL